MKAVTSPASLDLNISVEAQRIIMRDHPLVHLLQRTGEVPALRISDFLSRQAYHETGLYREVYRSGDAEYQMGCSLPSHSAPVQVGLTYNRKNRDFSNEEKLALDLLRAHLYQAYRNAELVTQFQGRMLFADQVLEAARQGVILLNDHGQILFCSKRASVWLADYFVAGRAQKSRQLPQPLRAWLQRQEPAAIYDGLLKPPRNTLAVERNGRRLLVKILSTSMPGQKILVLEESHTDWVPATLQCLGLTLREAEVLLWVSQGKTSPEIGQILSCRTATVNKHLEHIFAKLGVETRTAAAARAFEVCHNGGL